MADKTTELNSILEKGIDYKARRIYFGNKDNEGEFTWASVEETIRALNKLSEGASNKPIELHMSSTGGDTYQALRLYDAIQKCPCQIRFFGSGELCSAAIWILAGCDERYVDPNTCIMLHAGFVEGGDLSHTDSQIDNDEYNRLIDKLMGLLESNSRLPKDFWSEVCQRDTYITPEEAILLGLADKITEPQKRGNLRKVRAHALRQLPDKKQLNSLIKSIYKRIHKGKQLTKIEIHIPKEQFDKKIVVEPEQEDAPPRPTMSDKNIIINNDEKTIFIL